MKTKKKRPTAPRELVTLGMILTRKGGSMRDRRERRSKDDRRSFKREEW